MEVVLCYFSIMLFYYEGRIYRLEDCQLLKTEELTRDAYYKERETYLLPNGEEIDIFWSRWSNVPNLYGDKEVIDIPEEPTAYGCLYQEDESCEDGNGKKCWQEYWENEGLNDADIIISCDNIGMGSSTPNDYSYKGYTIYAVDMGNYKNYYIHIMWYDNECISELDENDLQKWLIYLWERFECQTALEYLMNNKHLFDEKLFVYL